jgi:hypothetical protein
MDQLPWIAKLAGAIIGVMISMIMVAPKSARNAFYRAAVSIPAGVIFAPSAQSAIFFLQGNELEHHVAAGCATGFTCWFILEATARFMSTEDTLRRLLEEMVRLAGKGGDKK